ASLLLVSLVGAAFSREQRIAEQRRREAAAKMEQLALANEEKSAFLSTVSHEFRTPLTVIASATGLLLDSGANLTPEQRALARNVQRNTARLNGMVADLLELARLREGRTALHPQLFEPAGLIQETVANLQPLFDGKQQRVRIEIEGELPALWADRKRLEHVLTNLLS